MIGKTPTTASHLHYFKLCGPKKSTPTIAALVCRVAILDQRAASAGLAHGLGYRQTLRSLRFGLGALAGDNGRHHAQTSHPVPSHVTRLRRSISYLPIRLQRSTTTLALNDPRRSCQSFHCS